MQKQQTCRCCLAVDGHFSYIHEIGTAQLYLDVVGVPVLTTDKFPQHVCSFCLRTLHRFSQFRARCRKALEVLYQSLVHGSEVTFECARSLSSNYRELKPQYIQTKTQTLEVLDSKNVDDTTINPLDLPETPVEFKVEKEEKQNEIKDATGLLEPKEESSKDVVYVDKGNESHYLEEDNDFDSFAEDFHEVKRESKKGKKKSKVNKVSRLKNLNKVTKQAKRKKKVKKRRESKSDKRVMMEYAESIGFNLTELSLEEQMQEIEEKKREIAGGLGCERCGKRFNNADCLQRHRNCHEPKPDSFMCDLCSWVFKKKNLLIEHMLDHRYIFSCKSCDFKTKKRITLKGHHEYHQGKRFPCKYCDKVFEKLSSYFTHVRFKHEAELPWCELCGEAFIGAKGVASHKKLTHDVAKEFPCACAECGARFRDASAAERHLAVRGCGRAACGHCGEGFLGAALLRHHLVQRHPAGALPPWYECGACLRRFHSAAARSRHACGAAAACAACGAGFAAPPLLAAHVADKHHIYNCEECSRQFTSKHFKLHFLLKHAGGPRRNRARKRASGQLEDRVRRWRVVDGESIKQVEGGAPPALPLAHICEVCGKGFPSSSKLSIHKWRVHRPARAQRCPLCDKSFKTREALDIHSRVHSGERPYQCAACPKAFKHRGAYTRHYLVHSGQRNHVCTMCEKTFQTSTGVKMHIQTAHMKMPWPSKARRAKPDPAPPH